MNRNVKKSKIPLIILAILSLSAIAYPACSIVTNPGSDTVEAGYPFIAKVTVGCDNASFAWVKNGSLVAGATQATMVIDPVSRSDSGAVFSCIVSKGSWRDTSAEAILTVIPPKNGNRLIVISGDLLSASQEPVGKNGMSLIEFTVKLFATARGVTPIYMETFSGGRSVPVRDGRFNVHLGRGEATGDLQKVVGENNNLFAELYTGPGTRLELIGPRIALTAAPYSWSSGVRVIYGSGSPVSADLKAAIGAIYVNLTDTSTWKKTASGWFNID